MNPTMEILLPVLLRGISGPFGITVMAPKKGSPTLTMKRCMMQKEDVLYNAGSAFTLITLSSANQSNPIVVDGRAIFPLAQSALKMGKGHCQWSNLHMWMEGFHPGGMMMI
jgi:hypothetical protein